MKYQIAEARKLRNITQAELAEKMRTTQQTIQRYETNQVNIRMDKMIEMSEILNVSLAYLLGMSSKPELSEASDMVPVPLLDSIAADTSIEMIDVDKTYDIPSEIHNKYPRDEDFISYFESLLDVYSISDSVLTFKYKLGV